MLDWTHTIGRTAEAGTAPALEDPHWSGSFEEYILCVLSQPRVLGRAVERLSDLLEGEPESTDDARRLPPELEARLRAALESATLSDGAQDPRVLLAAGSGDVERWAEALSRALEADSATPHGARFTFQWALGVATTASAPAEEGGDPAPEEAGEEAELGPPQEEALQEEPSPCEAGLVACPCDEEPFRLIPSESRRRILSEVNEARGDARALLVDGPVCPACSGIETSLLRRYHGDWRKMIEHVRVRRLLLSKEDRAGVVRLNCDEAVEAFHREGPDGLDVEAVAGSAPRAVLVLGGCESAVLEVARRLLDWVEGQVETSRTPPTASQRDFVILCDAGAVDEPLRMRLGGRAVPLGE